MNPSRSDTFDRRRVAPEGAFRNASLYLVGEAPGAEEAEEGRPFVGPAGRLLREMLRDAGVDVARVRFANAVPFRPVSRNDKGDSRNRKPSRAEIDEYGRAVLTDIRRTRPALIVALGGTAASLFGIDEPIANARAQSFCFEGRPLRVTYHPGYVQRFGRAGSEPRCRMVGDLRRFWREAT